MPRPCRALTDVWGDAHARRVFVDGQLVNGRRGWQPLDAVGEGTRRRWDGVQRLAHAARLHACVGRYGRRVWRREIAYNVEQQ